eukprot:scaffold243949_cov36-Tisochrysis_lutea.AAC.2
MDIDTIAPSTYTGRQVGVCVRVAGLQPTADGNEARSELAHEGRRVPRRRVAGWLAPPRCGIQRSSAGRLRAR